MQNEILHLPEHFSASRPRHHTIHDYLRILVKRRWAALAVFVLVVSTTALYSFTTTPLYQATVQILVERTLPRVMDTKENPGGESKSEEFYQTQYKLLESKALAKRVVNKLNLKQHPFYSPIFRGLPKDADEAKIQQAEERLFGSIISNVVVSPIRTSSLVNISFLNPDPKLAAQIVNALAQSYIEQSMDLRHATYQEAGTWMNQKIGEARKKLEVSEIKLNQYKKEHNIVALEDKETITAQKLEQLNRELITAQTRRMEAETRFNEVSRGHPIRDVLANPLIQNLKAEEGKIISQISELTKKYGEKHPRMIQLNSELAAIRGKIGAEMGHVIQTVKNEYHMASAQEANLKAAMETSKGETQDMSDRAIQYRVLLRDVETNRALYENMLKGLKEAAAIESLPATNIRVVYPAVIPGGPAKPRKFFNLALASFLGLILGCALAFGLENFDTTLKSPDEVEEWLEIPNLALIPHLEISDNNPTKGIQELVMHHDRQPLASEAYRGLRTSILFSTPGQAPRILLVTSSLPLEGKSLTAANLAAAMAIAESTVLLVDADLRRPTLHQIFQVEREPGLADFLAGEISDLPVVPTPVPHLFLVPCGHLPPNPSEMLHSERMQEFLNRAREQFGRVILDSPPLMSVTDPAILATMAEGVLLVIKAETVPRKVAIEARNDLLEVNAPLLGAILNNVPLQRDGYYYRHYYHRHYSYHYAQEDKRTQRQNTTHNPVASSGLLSWINNRRDRVANYFHGKQ